MSMCFTFFSWETTDVKNMIVVGSCYFLLTLLIPYDPNIDFVFPLKGAKDLTCSTKSDSKRANNNNYII